MYDFILLHLIISCHLLIYFFIVVLYVVQHLLPHFHNVHADLDKHEMTQLTIISVSQSIMISLYPETSPYSSYLT